MIRSCFAVVLLVTSLGIHRASADDGCPGVVDGICVDGVCTPYNEHVCPLAENQCDDYLDHIADDCQYEEVFEALTETVDEPSQDVDNLTSGHDAVYDAEVYGVESTDANETAIVEESASETPAIDATETPAVDEYNYDEYYEYYDETFQEDYVPEPHEGAASVEADVTEAVEVEETAAEEETEAGYDDESYYDYDDDWYDEYEQYNEDSSTSETPAADTAGPTTEPTAEETDDVELYDDYDYGYYGYDYDDYGRDYWNDFENEVTEEATQEEEETADDRDDWSGNEEAAAVDNADEQADIYENFYEEFYYDEDYDDFWLEDHQPETQEEENLLLEETNEVVDESVSPPAVEAALPLTHAIIECIRQSSLGPMMPEWTQDAVNDEECGMPPLADAVNNEVASEPLEEEYDSWDGWDCWKDDCHDAENKIVAEEQPMAVAELLIDGRNQAMLKLAKMLDGASAALESASLSLTQMAGEDVSDRSMRSENQQR